VPRAPKVWIVIESGFVVSSMKRVTQSLKLGPGSRGTQLREWIAGFDMLAVPPCAEKELIVLGREDP